MTHTSYVSRVGLPSRLEKEVRTLHTKMVAKGAHNEHPPPYNDNHRTLGIGLLWVPTGGLSLLLIDRS